MILNLSYKIIYDRNEQIKLLGQGRELFFFAVFILVVDQLIHLMKKQKIKLLKTEMYQRDKFDAFKKMLEYSDSFVFTLRLIRLESNKIVCTFQKRLLRVLEKSLTFEA